MRKDGVLHVLTDDPPSGPPNAISKSQKEDQKARPHIFLNIGEEPATLITSILLAGAITKEVWKKLTETYKKENIQSKLNLRTQLHNLRFEEEKDLQGHLTKLEEIFIDLGRLNDPVSEKEKRGTTKVVTRIIQFHCANGGGEQYGV